MLATHYSSLHPANYKAASYGQEEYGSLLRADITTGSRSGGFREVDSKVTAILGERNINVDSNKQPEDQEGAVNVVRKRQPVSAEVGLQQEQQVPSKEVGRGLQELVGEENASDDCQVKQLRSLGDEPGDKTKEYRLELVWTNVIGFIILHSSLPLAIYLIHSQRPWLTVAFSILGAHLSMVGALAGAHRLWSHRSYKARWPAQVLLLVFHSMAGQNSAYTWARDHRMHHKYSETDADPHNIKRGLFFAHMGWLCLKKHPEVREKGKQIDMSDLESNPYVMFQHRYFWWMSLVFAVLVPTIIPVLCWGERFWTSFVISFMLRYIVTLHWTWTLNSAAHYHGARPYDTNILACQSNLLICTGIGEGAHNYHHTFPYDYANSEYDHYNFPTAFIDFCAYLGLVNGRRRASSETILKRRERTGGIEDSEKAMAAETNCLREELVCGTD